MNENENCIKELREKLKLTERRLAICLEAARHLVKANDRLWAELISLRPDADIGDFLKPDEAGTGKIHEKYN